MIVLQNGLLLDPATGTERTGDLFLDGDRIVSPSDELPEDTLRIDATGCWVSPALVDTHCHLRDPGQSEREDIASGTAAAAKGGFGLLCPMANTAPPVDNPATLSYIHMRAREVASTEVRSHACLSRDMSGQELVDMSGLLELGAVAFSDDGLPYANGDLLRVGLMEAGALGAVVVSHAEDKSLSQGGSMRSGASCLRLGHGGIPAAAESAAVARELEILADAPGGHLHFSHISTARSLRAIRRAKQDGLSVSAETTPHHLTLTSSAVEVYGTHAKMNPPLGEEEDRRALLEGVLDGTIDALGTDHAPHTMAAKSLGMEKAPFGITNFEVALPLYLEALYHSGSLRPLQLLALLTSNPGRCLRIRDYVPSLEPGSKANVTVIDPHQEWTWRPSDTTSKSRNSPFYDRSLQGKAVCTILRGRIVSSSARTNTPGQSG